MTVEDIIKRAHRMAFADTDYPTSGTEDALVSVDGLNDGIAEWESLVEDGVIPEELLTSSDVVFGGSGTDTLPTDFRAFVPSVSDRGWLPPSFYAGSSQYRFVPTSEGMMRAQAGSSMEAIFWREGANIRTLPAISGTVSLPYVKKATRAVSSTDTFEPECPNSEFLVSFLASRMAIDNEDDTTKYQLFASQASEKLSAMASRYASRMADNARY